MVLSLPNSQPRGSSLTLWKREFVTLLGLNGLKEVASPPPSSALGFKVPNEFPMRGPGFINCMQLGTRYLNTGGQKRDQASVRDPETTGLASKAGRGTSKSGRRRAAGGGVRLAPACSGGPQLGASLPLGRPPMLSCPPHAAGRGPSLPGAGTGTSGFGLLRQGCLSQGHSDIRAGVGQLFQPMCPPVTVPSTGSLLASSCTGAGLVASSEKFNSREEEETAGWNLHTGEWKTSPAPGRGGRSSRGRRGGEEVGAPVQQLSTCLPQRSCCAPQQRDGLGARQGAFGRAGLGLPSWPISRAVPVLDNPPLHSDGQELLQQNLSRVRAELPSD